MRIYDRRRATDGPLDAALARLTPAQRWRVGDLRATGWTLRHVRANPLEAVLWRSDIGWTAVGVDSLLRPLDRGELRDGVDIGGHAPDSWTLEPMEG